MFKTFAYSELKCLSYSLVYQLFFRTCNLLLYPLLIIESITNSLVIHSFIRSVVYELQGSE